MKTFLVTVNSRAMYGDPAKEANVGVYQTDKPDEFKIALQQVMKEMPPTWQLSQDRVTMIKGVLKRYGFVPLETESLFVPIN